MAKLLDKLSKIFQNDQLSAVAAIVKENGDLDRVVVGPIDDMQWHIVEERHEKLVIIPDKWIKEPVPWNDQPALITSVERYIAALKFTKELENK